MNTCTTVDMSYFENAPQIIVKEVEINKPVEEVFASLESDNDWAEWVGQIAKVEWTSPKPFQVGTTRRVTFTNDTYADEVFIAWETNKRMAFCFTETTQGGSESFAEDYQLTDLGNGRTRLRWIVAMTPKGFSKIVFALFGFLVKRMIGKMLVSFKDFMEAK